MNLKKIKYISIFSLLIISVLFHYGYTVLPNELTAIFFPVNESIWEHMKLLYTSVLVYHVIEYFFIRKHININNVYLNLLIVPISSILIYLFIYFITKPFITHNTFSYISIMIITFILIGFISYFILKSKNNIFIPTYLFCAVIIIIYIIFGYLTYHPIKNDLFLDPLNNQYGIGNYIIK